MTKQEKIKDLTIGAITVIEEYLKKEVGYRYGLAKIHERSKFEYDSRIGSLELFIQALLLEGTDWEEKK